mgnify:CR=1 FL=1
MLILSRKRNEKIMIGDDIVVKVLDLKENQVKIGIVAPKNISVHRQEIYEAIQAENAQAAAAVGVAVPKDTVRTSTLIDGAVWDGTDPAAYAASFKIRS